MKKVYTIIIAVIGLIAIGFFIPYPLGTPTPRNPIINGTICIGDCDGPHRDIFVEYLFMILIPIIALLGVIILFYPSKKNDISKSRKGVK